MASLGLKVFLCALALHDDESRMGLVKLRTH